MDRLHQTQGQCGQNTADIGVGHSVVIFSYSLFHLSLCFQIEQRVGRLIDRCLAMPEPLFQADGEEDQVFHNLDPCCPLELKPLYRKELPSWMEDTQQVMLKQSCFCLVHSHPLLPAQTWRVRRASQRWLNGLVHTLTYFRHLKD